MCSLSSRSLRFFAWLFCVALKTQYGSLKPPVGPLRLKVIELMVALLRCNTLPELCNRIAALDLIPLAIDLFFTYEWHNILHGLVEHIIQMILSGTTTVLSGARLAVIPTIGPLVCTNQNDQCCVQ